MLRPEASIASSRSDANSSYDGKGGRPWGESLGGGPAPWCCDTYSPSRSRRMYRTPTTRTSRTNRTTATTAMAATLTATSGSGTSRPSAEGSRERSIGGVGIGVSLPTVLRVRTREPVADAGHREDVARLTRVGLDLATEVTHVDVDDAGGDGVLVPPHRRQDAVPREHLPGIACEEGEQVELRVRQRHLVRSTHHAPFGGVHRQPPEGETPAHSGARCCLTRLAEVRCHAGEQFAGPEGLVDEVVGADFQAEHDVDLVVLGGEDQHGNAVARATDLAADVESADVGQHEVEKNEVGVRLIECGEHAGAAVELGHRVALCLAGQADRLADQLVVLDDQHCGLTSIQRMILHNS